MAAEVVPDSGSMTFLFTDVEGSTQRWERDAALMETALADHDAVLSEVIEENGGTVFKHTGDGMCAVFGSAQGAVAAAVAAQRALDLPVRMGLHTGEATERDGDFFGPALNRTARVMDTGHGGQVVMSAATASLLTGVELMDLGSHRLRGLDAPEQMFQVLADGLQVDFPPLRVDFAGGTNLPPVRSSFVGRTSELAAVDAGLSAHRVVTLTGVGGVGKTRLALEVAAQALPMFPHGVWFCDLAPTSSTQAIVEVVASAVGIDQQSSMTLEDSVVAGLRRRHCLLVFDNCEHIVDEVVDVVEAILDTCEQVVVLTTSREGLAIDGEQLIVVPPLSVGDGVPGSPSDAVELFMQRASAAVSDFAVDHEDAAAVTEVCTRLDGVPLAIELAAARTTTLTPVELLDRLDDRFRLLTGGRRRARDRHQTLRRTVDWSYDLLDPSTRLVMQRLAVFGGSFDLAAAEVVTAGDGAEWVDVFEEVSELVAKSMLTTERLSGQTRYRFLETLRQYAEERLEESGELDDAMAGAARHFVATAGATSEALLGADHEQALRRLELDLPNYRRVVEVAVDAVDIDTAFGVIAPFHRHVNGPSTLFTRMATAVLEALPDVDHPLGPAVLTVSAEEHMARGDNNTAARLIDLAVAMGRRLGHEELASTLVVGATFEPGRGRISEGYDLALRAVRAASQTDEPHLEVAGHLHRISLGRALGILDTDEAIADARALVGLAENTISPTARAQARWTLGDALITTSPAEALAEFTVCQELAVGGRVAAGGVIFSAWCQVLLGRLDDTLATLAPAMRQWRLNSHQLYLELSYVLIANVISTTHTEDAARLLGAARDNGELAFYLPAALDRAVDIVTSRLGPEHAEQLMAAAGGEPPEVIADLAISFLDA